MQKSVRGVWGSLRRRQSSGRGNLRDRAYVRPFLESLEDRVTPTTTVTANAVISGFVYSGGSSLVVPGVEVLLTGNTTTGRTIYVAAVTNSSGAYTFNSVLPGTYALSELSTPTGFVPGTVSTLSNISVAEGQTVAGNNLNVGGLAAPRISLAFYLTDSPGPQGFLPAAGAGMADGYSLNINGNPLTNTSVGVGSTNYIDLSGNFYDPDTTDTTVTFDVTYSEGGNTTPVQGQIQVQLFDTDAPQTVTNFLDYIESGAYSDDLFHRIANLTSGNTGTPQILQAGGFTVTPSTTDPGDISTIGQLTTAYQPILSEYSAAHPNAVGTIAMALSNGPDSATSQFYFNLTNNSSALGPSNPSGPFTVFGQITGSMTDIDNIMSTSNYVATDVSNTTNFPNSNSAFGSLPLSTALGTPPAPGSTFPAGEPLTSVPIINSITVTTPSLGRLSYVVTSSNPSVVTAMLGANGPTNTFDANQLQLMASSAGSSVITVQVTDAAGEVVTQSFTVTVS
jgi:cyclophilin family peptidyl-prolyl cis-trans isomerase